MYITLMENCTECIEQAMKQIHKHKCVCVCVSVPVRVSM